MKPRVLLALRTGVLLALVLAAFVAGWRGLGPERGGQAVDPGLAGLITTGAAWLLQLALGWLLVAVVLALLEVAGRPRPPALLCPGWTRRLVVLCCGLGVLVAAPAQAEETAPQSPPGSLSEALAGLRLPDRVSGGVDHTVDPEPGPRRTVTVRPGDSLWAIARRDLPARASVPDVASAVDRLVDANPRLTDPDLIHPGQVLRLPTTPEEHR